MSLYLGENLISGQATLVGESRNIGQIIPSAIPLTDAGLHLLDGSLILGDGIYSAFVDYIAGLYGDGTNIPSYFCTETEWQTSVTTYGVCGKFVYDATANTVRLPKVTGKVDGTTDINALGDLEPLFVRLPNITATWRSSQDRTQTGAAYRINTGQSGYGGSYFGSDTGFDASRSSSVYSGNGSDTTIHEQAINVLYYIVIATSTKTDIEVDIDEVVTDLNGKADTDLTNVTDTAKVMMSGMGMPSNKYINLTLNASGSTYTAPADGWVVLKLSGTGGWTQLRNNTAGEVIFATSLASYAGMSLPVKKNDTFQVEHPGSADIFRFVYAKGSESEAS